MLLTFVHLQTGWSSISCFRMFFSSASRPKYCQTTLFVFFFATKLSLVGLVAISCSHSRAHTLVPRPSSTAHARLSSSQYIDNVLETVVGLSPMHIIIELLWYWPTLILSDHENWGCPLFQCWKPLFLFSSLDTEVGGWINCSNVGCRLWLRRNDQFFLFLKIDYLGWSLEFNHVPVRSLCAWFNNFTCGLDLQPLIGQIFLQILFLSGFATTGFLALVARSLCWTNHGSFAEIFT